VSGRLTLLLGGARAGKSTLAQSLAERCGPRVLFIATAEPLDAEMASRIAIHRASRPASWTTIEEPLDPVSALPSGAFDSVILDCVTLWVSNLVEVAGGDALEGSLAEAFLTDLDVRVDGLVVAARDDNARWFVVSNEVGLGVVPAYPLGRLFRDALGRVNQRLAAAADDVALVVAGLPITLKGELVSQAGDSQ
jgi:adenosylcobinamide kinase/adenosylcobinamide-phosphate guanylyltransferase